MEHNDVVSRGAAASCFSGLFALVRFLKKVRTPLFQTYDKQMIANPSFNCRIAHAFNVTPSTSRLQRHAFNVTPSTSRLQRHAFNVTPSTSRLQRDLSRINHLLLSIVAAMFAKKTAHR